MDSSSIQQYPNFPTQIQYDYTHCKPDWTEFDTEDLEVLATWFLTKDEGLYESFDWDNNLRAIEFRFFCNCPEVRDPPLPQINHYSRLPEVLEPPPAIPPASDVVHAAATADATVATAVTITEDIAGAADAAVDLDAAAPDSIIAGAVLGLDTAATDLDAAINLDVAVSTTG